MKILSLLILLLFVVPLNMATAGYSRDPWGSKTWEGPGRPPHWSSPRPATTSEPRDSINTRRYHRPDRYRYHYRPFPRHKKFQRIIIYRQKTVEEPTVIEKKTVIKTRHIPAPRRLSPQRCGGDTVYLKDRTTGELIIRYISPAKAC